MALSAPQPSLLHHRHLYTHIRDALSVLSSPTDPYVAELLRDRCPSHLNALRTVGIVVGQLREAPVLFHVLSGGHVARLVASVPERDLVESGDLFEQYCAFLKTISIRLDALTIQFFVDTVFSGGRQLARNFLRLARSSDS